MADAQVLSFTEDLKAAIEEIENHGGRVVHRFSKRAFTALLPAHIAASLEHSTTKELSSLTPAEQLLIGAWRDYRERAAEPESGPRTAELVQSRNPTSDPMLAEQQRRLQAWLDALGYAPTELHTVMHGSVTAGLVFVSGPMNDLAFNNEQYRSEVAKFFKGADFLATTEPRASISFAYDNPGGHQ